MPWLELPSLSIIQIVSFKVYCFSIVDFSCKLLFEICQYSSGFFYGVSTLKSGEWVLQMMPAFLSYGAMVSEQNQLIHCVLILPAKFLLLLLPAVAKHTYVWAIFLPHSGATGQRVPIKPWLRKIKVNYHWITIKLLALTHTCPRVGDLRIRGLEKNPEAH